MIVDLRTLDQAYSNIKRNSHATGGACSVLILVSPECDSLCACKILTSLLQYDGIKYMIEPVAGYDDVHRLNQTTLQAGDDTIRSIVMINCGGIVDLRIMFDLTSEFLCVYVIDNHRPYHLANVRAENDRVWLLHDGEEGTDAYPSDDDVSDDDDDFGESSDEDGGGGGDNWDVVVNNNDENASGLAGNRRRRQSSPGTDKARSSRRRRISALTYEEIQTRRDKRRRIAEYYRSSYFGHSSSFIAYELANQLDMTSNELLWLGIVGTTDLFLRERMDYNAYSLWSHGATEEVMRLNRLENDDHDPDKTEEEKRIDDSLVPRVNVGYIAFQNEFRFMLLRHWSLFDAMYHSLYISTRLGVWRDHGIRQLQKLLAKVGIPLKDCKAPYAFMSQELKHLLVSEMPNYAKAFGLDQLQYGSFFKVHGSNVSTDVKNMVISAADMVYAVTALLEKPTTEDVSAVDAGVWDRNFWHAYDGLSNQNTRVLQEGIDLAMYMQKIVMRYGTALLHKKSIISSGPFRYVILDEGPDTHFFTTPMALSKLGLFLVHSLRVVAQKKPKPFVIACPLKLRKTYLVIGVSGTGSERVGKNSFGTAFREACEKSSARIKHDGFETSMLEIQQDDVLSFMEVLHSGLVVI